MAPVNPADARPAAPVVVASNGAVARVRPPARPAARRLEPARAVSLGPVAPLPFPSAPPARRTRRWGAVIGASAGWIAGGLIGNVPGLIVMGALSGAAGSRRTADAASRPARDSTAAAASPAAAAPPRPTVPRTDSAARPAPGARP
jgi:hypothetical protein